MSDEMRIVRQWDELMQNFIKNDMTFLVHSIKKEEWGYNLMVTIPPGRTFDELEKLKDAIKVHYPCNVEMEIRKLTALANVKLITKDFSEVEFNPVKCKPYEVFIGYDVTGKPIIVSMNQFPNILVAGSVGSGKSRLIFMIITNLIFNGNIDLYLTQIRKRDLKKFQPYSTCFADEEKAAAMMFDTIQKEIAHRIKMFDKYDCENIEEYNKKFKNNPLRYKYVFSDEFSFFMPDNTDSDELKYYKNLCLDKLKDIIKTARAVGIFVITAIQKTTADELLPIIKAQMKCKISFSMTSKPNSFNIIECDDAFMLPQREFILMTDKLQHCKTPYIDKEMIKSYLTIPIEEKHVSEPMVNARLQINYVHTIDIPKKFKKFCERIIKPVEDTSNVGQFARGRRRDKNVDAKGQKST